MTKFGPQLAAVVTAALLAMAAPAIGLSEDGPRIGTGASGGAGIRLAQADVTVRIGTAPAKRKVVKKRVVKKGATVRSSTVVVTPRHKCRTVTVRKRVGGKVVVSKTRRCT
jgi:hypothetical protein